MKHVVKAISAVMIALLFVTSIQAPTVSAAGWEDDYFQIEAETRDYYVEYGQVQELEVKVVDYNHKEIKDLSDYKIEWEHNGDVIPNATTTSYVVDTAQAGSVGKYTVTITKGGNFALESLYVEVDTQLYFEDECGGDYKISVGDSVAMNAKATSLATKNITYKWEKADLIVEENIYDYNNMKQLDNTTAVLKLDNITREEYGAYICTAYDGINTAEKTFYIEPDSKLEGYLEGDSTRIVGLGETVTMEVTATSNYEIEYQWYKGDELIKGATSNKLKINQMKKENYGVYRCQVKDEFCSYLYDVRLKTFDLSSAADSEMFGVYEKDFIGLVGDSLTMQVNGITKAPGVDLTFTWIKNSDHMYEESSPEVIKGVTTDTYTIPAVEKKSSTNTNEFKVIVTDGITEDVIYVCVNAQEDMYFTRLDGTFFGSGFAYTKYAKSLGDEMSFTLLPKVKSGYKVTYQWFVTDEQWGDESEESGEKMIGENAPTLTFSSVNKEHLDKYYYCMAYVTTKDGIVKKKSGTFDLGSSYDYDDSERDE